MPIYAAQTLGSAASRFYRGLNGGRDELLRQFAGSPNLNSSRRKRIVTAKVCQLENGYLPSGTLVQPLMLSLATSRGLRSMMPEDLKEQLRAFNDHGAKYLIAGAYAFGVHAEPCATKDLDIFIRSDAENSRRIRLRFSTKRLDERFLALCFFQ